MSDIDFDSTVTDYTTNSTLRTTTSRRWHRWSTTIAIRAGLALAVLGMVEAYQMAFNVPQRVLDARGEPVVLGASHTVIDAPEDTAEDVAGMPLTHWSTNGGDLRIAHFLGLHGIQAMLLGVVLLALPARRYRWLRAERARARLIGVYAVGYAGLFALVLWQALRAQSLIHPDAITVAALGGLLSVVGALAVLVYMRERTAGPHERKATGTTRLTIRSQLSTTLISDMKDA